jgi:hypothetical protein
VIGDYHLFEILPDRSVRWRGAVSDHEDAIHKLHELSTQTTNELQLIDIASQTLIATLHAPESSA